MAAQDGANRRLDRARRIGARLVERLGLVPPVDIEGLAWEYADVEFDAIPGPCDAVVIGLDGKSRARPLIIVDRGHHPHRQRFSLGHELGHVLIPGHLGLELCETSTAYGYGTPIREREAQEFASEVLLPTRWLHEIVRDTEDLSAILSEVEIANVSAAAACFAVHRALAPGYVIAVLLMGSVELCLASPETEANLPAQGSKLNESLISRFSTDSGNVTFRSRRVQWWRFDQEAVFTEPEDQRTASEILREIVEEVYGDDIPLRNRALNSINGIAGHAGSPVAYRTVTSPNEMLARLRTRFADRPEHEALVSHPKFDDYLVRKAQELAAR